MMAGMAMTARHTTESSLSGTLTAFSEWGANSSLYVLKAVTVTVDSMGSMEKVVQGFSEYATSLAQSLNKDTKVLDSDDVIINALERMANMIDDELIPMLTKKRDAIDRDPTLKEDHQTLLHCAYMTFMSALESWSENTKALRSAVITHDLAVERGKEPIFDSPDELFHSIRDSIRN